MVILLVALVVAVCWLANDSAPPAVVISPTSLIPPAQLKPNSPVRRAFYSFTAWLSRLLGLQRTVLLNTKLLECRFAPDTSAALLELGKPAFTDTNGLRVWILSREEQQKFDKRLRQTQGVSLLSSPRLTTANKCQAQIKVSESVFVRNGKSRDGLPPQKREVGPTLDLLPRVRGNSIDLVLGTLLTATVLNQPEGTGRSVVTNLEFFARVQLTNGGGAFFLKTKPGGESNTVGVLVSADLPSGKK